MKPAALVTVCRRATLAAALDLAATFGDHHPGARVEVVVADAAPGPAGAALVSGAEVAGAAFGVLATAYGGSELEAALIPFALRRAGAGAIYLAPDAVVLGPIDLPSEDGALLAASSGDEGAGVCDDGFLALVGAGGVPALDWWAAEGAQARAPERPLEALAARRDELVVVHRETWAVAPWNEQERAGDAIAWARLLDDEDDGDTPSPALARLAAERADRIAEGAAPAAVAAATGVDALYDGTPLDDRLRRLFRRALHDGAVEGAAADEAAFRLLARWLADPDPDHRSGGVSRVLFDVWLGRPDLHAAYGDLNDPDQRDGFVGWAVVFGLGEERIPAWVLPEEALDRHGAAPDDGTAGPRPDAPPPFGVNLAGYLQSTLGIGTVARSLVGAFDAAHVPVLPVTGVLQPPTGRAEAFEATAPQAVSFPFNVVCVNADGLPGFAHEAGPAFFDGRYTVGYWWWELPELPDELHEAFALVQEVWVGSSFVREALERVSPVPVVQMPLPVAVAPVVDRPRAALGLPEGFLAMAFVDFNSVMARKNPLGAIEAFARAFDGNSAHPPATLVIKHLNGHLHPRALQELSLVARRHPGVRLLDRYVARSTLDSMVASADVFVSLHRSEGFGLPLAEAMALGTPVLATGWSGNADFVDDAVGWPVPYELVAVGPGNAPYAADSRWAEPDVDAAARMLREIRDAPELAARKAQAGQRRIRERYAPAVAGAAMRDRLAALYPRVADERHVRRAEATLTATTPDLDALRAGAEPPSRPFQTGGRPDPARKVARSVVAPAVRYQTELDTQILRYVDALSAELARTREEHAALTAAALKGHRRLDARLDGVGARFDAVDARIARLEELITAVGRGLEALHHRFDALGRDVAPVLHGAQARPWTTPGSFAFEDDPALGRRVLAFGGDETEDYAGFEAVFRGPRERVDELLEHYVPLLADHAPVLDVGAGRGELLALLAAAGIEAAGVDSDASMAAEARAAGLDVEVGDGIAALQAREPGSLGAVTAMHVVEHLPYDALLGFLAGARAALRPGGVLMAETINPHAPAALKTFWTDPTHRHPLLPETMIVLARGAGFGRVVATFPRGVGDAEVDLLRSDAYTLVATA
ncbi:glycosyltransferase [Baekduia alba]|uniref:methyltransferase domain-containing protein n=1 Tax=Baekduia alba TaxID=2997333 RepID=UPI0023416FA9|nr:methyltransferase domain-containing protein [Baekduia alba]WCB96573.1 glycosyltransferase [Baekduia alba]